MSSNPPGARAQGAETAQAESSRRVKAAATETALKSAALRVFERRGYINAKITDITAEAGRSAGSFYSHFPNKESLLETLLVDWIREMGQELAGDTIQHDLMDREHLRWHVGVVWTTYKRHRPLLIALEEAAIISETFAQRLRSLRYDETSLLRSHLDEARASGVMLPGRSAVLASAIVSLLGQFCRVWVLEGGEPAARQLSDDEAIDTLTDLLLHGLAGRSSGST